MITLQTIYWVSEKQNVSKFTRHPEQNIIILTAFRLYTTKTETY